uniref:Uncharacterized protein n=1 Tax=viral metagenome TaxID=1070528 RepID=A0A6C0H4S9_9ZZZZ
MDFELQEVIIMEDLKMVINNGIFSKENYKYKDNIFLDIKVFKNNSKDKYSLTIVINKDRDNIIYNHFDNIEELYKYWKLFNNSLIFHNVLIKLDDTALYLFDTYENHKNPNDIIYAYYKTNNFNFVISKKINIIDIFVLIINKLNNTRYSFKKEDIGYEIEKYGLFFIRKDTYSIIYHYSDSDFNEIIKKYFENIKNVFLVFEKNSLVIDSFLKIGIEESV